MDKISLHAFISKVEIPASMPYALNNISIVVMMTILRPFYVQPTGVLNGKSRGHTRHVALHALSDILVPRADTVLREYLISCIFFNQSKFFFLLPRYYASYSVYILPISIVVKRIFSV
jgi:hypothetical protein